MLTPSHEEPLEQYVDGCFVRDCTDAHVRMRHTRLRTHPPTCTLAHSLYMTSTNSQGHSDSVRLLLAQSLMPFMGFVLHKKHTYVRTYVFCLSATKCRLVSLIARRNEQRRCQEVGLTSLPFSLCQIMSLRSAPTNDAFWLQLASLLSP